MLEYDRIDASEGIDNTRNKLVSKECWMCHFWYFIDKNFNFDERLCNGCHDMSVKAVSMNNLAVVYVGANEMSRANASERDSAYRINFPFISKNDAINLIKNAAIIDKRGVL